MNDEELISFLKKSRRTPDMIRNISESLSLLGTKKLLEPIGWVLTDDEWEEISSIRRKDFVESIRVIQDGGAVISIGEI